MGSGTARHAGRVETARAPSPQNKNTQYNPQFLLKLSRPGHVFIQLEQTKPGHAPGRPSEKKSIAAFVLQLDGKRIGSGIYGGMIKNTAPYINADMVSMEIPNLRPDPKGYTILCTTYGVSFFCFVCLLLFCAVVLRSLLLSLQSRLTHVRTHASPN